jgi:hypothetical protein
MPEYYADCRAKFKRHLLFDSGHPIPRRELITGTLGWFDRYLGPLVQQDIGSVSSVPLQIDCVNPASSPCAALTRVGSGGTLVTGRE